VNWSSEDSPRVTLYAPIFYTPPQSPESWQALQMRLWRASWPIPATMKKDDRNVTRTAD
jgi:hypothetical protein